MRRSLKKAAESAAGTSDTAASAQEPGRPMGAPTEEMCRAWALFIERLSLTDADRQELRRKRGFTDATIDALRIRSGGDVARHALDSLRGDVADAALVEARLYRRRAVVGKDVASGDTDADTGAIEPSLVWCAGPCVIPYLDADGACVGIKRHKGQDGAGYWPEGVPAQLYVPHLPTIRARDVLVLTEGELKSVALAQLGFFALGVPGITSFVGANFPRLMSWVRAHGSPSVLICFDAEDKRARIADVFQRHDTSFYAWRLAYQLEREGIEARIATLPLEWDSQRRKVDCDSALAAGHTRADFAAVFRDAVTPGEYLRADSRRTGLDEEARLVLTGKMSSVLCPNYQLVMPDTSERRHGRVCEMDGDSLKGVVCHGALWLGGQGASLDTDQRYLTLAYTRYAQHGRAELRTVVVKRGDALNKARLIELADVGLPVDSSNAGKVVSYLSALEAAVSPYLSTDWLTARNGWHGDGVHRQFVLGNAGVADADTVARLYAPGGEDARIAAGLTASGSFETSLQLMSAVRSASSAARFGLAAGFAAPLLDPCRVRSFVLHCYGASGSGKSALATLVAGLYGCPEALMATLYTTVVAVERKASLYCDLPVVLDELQLQSNPDIRRMLSYLIAQGTGKGRGNPSGGLRDTARWRVVALTTGEEPLTTADDFGGQAARVLELRAQPISDGALARRVHLEAKEHYGHIGRLFIKKLLTALSELGVEWIRAEHRRMTRSIQEALPTLRGAVLDALGVIALADALAAEWVFGEDVGDEHTFGADSVALAAAVYSDQEATAPYGARALDWVLAWFASNKAHFADSSGLEMQPCYGEVLPTGDLYLLSSVWREAVEHAGFNARRVLDDWQASGWIALSDEARSASDKRTVRVRVPRRYVRGERVRVVHLLAQARALGTLPHDEEEDAEEQDNY